MGDKFHVKNLILKIRDLLLTFSNESRWKESFFHNANSAISKKIWEKFRFDDSTTNIEDRLFGKQLIDNNYEIFYNSKAEVTHFHGLHQTNNLERLGVTRIFEKNKLISYENEEFIEINKKNIKITIVSKNIKKILNDLDKDILVITNNKKYQDNRGVLYLPYNKNDKVLNILLNLQPKLVNIIWIYIL